MPAAGELVLALGFLDLFFLGVSAACVPNAKHIRRTDKKVDKIRIP